METVKLIIDRKPVEVPKGTTILDAAKGMGIRIPTLCYMKLEDLHYENNPGACRICVVEIEGRRNLAPSCKTECMEGMVVQTHSPRVMNARKTVMELILSNHPAECLTCSSNGHCELQAIAHDLGIREIRYKGEMSIFQIDRSPSIVRNMNKCIMCRRCETMCNNIQTVGALTAVNRGFNAAVSTAFERDIAGSTCSYCGQCVSVCPVNALSGRNTQQPVLDALADPDKIVIAQTAPAVRTALGRDFGYEPGTLVTGKMVSALRRLGFDYVFDTDFAADLTIMEEGTELLQRIGKYLKGDQEVKMPLMTSCCPGWVSFVEQHFPELLDNLSTAKSPQQMFGAVMKTYFAEKLGVSPEKIYTVSVMPCVAKKSEREMDLYYGEYAGHDVDAVVTTRELLRMIRAAHIEPSTLVDQESDRPMQEGTGAGVIFGATGGVMEAALRTAYYLLKGENPPADAFQAVRSTGFNEHQGVQEAVFQVDDVTVRTAAVSGLGNARALIDKIERGEAQYDFVEVMACPGGCIGGGGQPFHRGRMEVLRKRAAALYQEDRSKTLRKSHENPYIQALYADYLGEPCGPRAHKLLHTHYFDRKEAINMFTQENQEG